MCRQLVISAVVLIPGPAQSFNVIASGSFLSLNSRGKLSSFMTGTQTTLLHEGEYHQDQIPRMVRRHSLDSVSHIADSEHDASSGQHSRGLLGDAGVGERQSSPVSSKLSSLVNDNAPRAPARQRLVVPHCTDYASWHYTG